MCLVYQHMQLLGIDQCMHVKMLSDLNLRHVTIEKTRWRQAWAHASKMHGCFSCYTASYVYIATNWIHNLIVKGAYIVTTCRKQIATPYGNQDNIAIATVLFKITTRCAASWRPCSDRRNLKILNNSFGNYS